MHDFNDLGKFPKAKLKILTREVDMKKLTCAMHGLDKEIKEKVLSTLTKTNQHKFEALSIATLKAKKTEINKCREGVTDAMNRLFSQSRSME